MEPVTVGKGLDQLGAEPSLAALVRSPDDTIIGFAEGVEDGEMKLLQDFGVDYAHGFHLGRPAPLKPHLEHSIVSPIQ